MILYHIVCLQKIIELSTNGISVKQIMTKAVVSADISLPINEAAKMMEDAKVGALIVMENNTPVGIVTDRDFTVKVIAHSYHNSDPIKKIMSTPLISVSPDESVRMAADLMYTRQIRKLPVIDDDKVIGIITATDIVSELANCTEEELQKLYFNTISKIYQNYNPYQ